MLGITTMKLQTITFATLLALSATGTASADWFDGFNNGNGNGTVAGNSAANGQGNVASKGNGDAKGNGWGAGKGDADGEVDFNIAFKGKARTNMDTKAQLDGSTQLNGDALANAASNGNVAGNGAGNALGSNSANGQQGVVAKTQAAPVSSAQMKAALKAQIAQAMEMLKRIEAQEKAATPTTSVEKKS